MGWLRWGSFLPHYPQRHPPGGYCSPPGGAYQSSGGRDLRRYWCVFGLLQLTMWVPWWLYSHFHLPWTVGVGVLAVELFGTVLWWFAVKEG